MILRWSSSIEVGTTIALLLFFGCIHTENLQKNSVNTAQRQIWKTCQREYFGDAYHEHQEERTQIDDSATCSKTTVHISEIARSSQEEHSPDEANCELSDSVNESSVFVNQGDCASCMEGEHGPHEPTQLETNLSEAVKPDLPIGFMEWKEQFLSKVTNQHNQSSSNSTEIEEKLPTPEINIKDRFNYASHECGAKVLASNPEASETPAILVEAKDRYMLNPCEATKWVVLELCEEIGIDTLAIANYEFFSSMFKEFELSGSSKYPPVWLSLANFTAKNVREMQYFKLTEPAWYKYIKVDFHTHYGNEFYCPISEIQAHGSTLVEELKQQIEKDTLEVNELTNAMRTTKEEVVIPPTPVNDILQEASLEHAMKDISDSEDDEEDWDSVLRKTTNLVQLFEEMILSNGSSSLAGDIPAEVQSAEATEAAKPPDAQKITGDSSVPSDVKPSKTSQENIFKTLANRVKALEINQSLSNRYLEDVTSRYLSILKELKATLAKIETEHLQLSKAIHITVHELNSLAKRGADMEGKLEYLQTMAVSEVERRALLAYAHVTREMAVLKDEIRQHDQDRKNEIYTIAIIAACLIYFLFYWERQVVFDKLRASGSEDRVAQPNYHNHINFEPPPKMSKKKMQKELKKARSVGQLSIPNEAPV